MAETMLQNPALTVWKIAGALGVSRATLYRQFQRRENSMIGDKPIPDERLLLEVEDVMRAMPSRDTLGDFTPRNQQWLDN